MSAMVRSVLGIDVGGSSIKGGLVDIDAGLLQGELASVATPRPAAPEPVMQAVANLTSTMSRPVWIERVNVYLKRMQALFWPDAFILGGAVGERFEEFAPHLHSSAQIRPAHFAGQAGVIGAALAAAS